MSTKSSSQNPSNDTESTTAAIFEQFKVYFDQKLENLSSGFKATSESQAQKLQRQAEGANLKFPGNRNQFLFDNQVQDLLNETRSVLQKGDTDSVLKSIDNATKLITQRQRRS
ncbi:Hypothetical predicted protein, partial [Paramuricea clavata]